MQKKDIKDAEFIAKNGADFICFSFVRYAKDIERLKSLLGDGKIDVIAKIEKASALDNIDEIIKASNAIMIARGDPE